MSESDTPEKVSADDAREMLGTGEARSIDVRDQDAIAEGHAPGTVVVGDRSLKEAAEEVLRGDEGVPILVFGDGGSDSEEAAEELREQGFEAAAIKGGWSKWQSSGMPVQPRSDEEYEGPKQKQPGQA